MDSLSVQRTRAALQRAQGSRVRATRLGGGPRPDPARAGRTLEGELTEVGDELAVTLELAEPAGGKGWFAVEIHAPTAVFQGTLWGRLRGRLLSLNLAAGMEARTQRRNARYPLALDLQITSTGGTGGRAGDPGGPVHARCVDLGLGGLTLVSPVALRTGSRLDGVFETAPFDQVGRFQLEVVSCRFRGERWRLGCVFSQLTGDQRSALAHLLLSSLDQR